MAAVTCCVSADLRLTDLRLSIMAVRLRIPGSHGSRVHFVM